MEEIVSFQGAETPMAEAWSLVSLREGAREKLPDGQGKSAPGRMEGSVGKNWILCFQLFFSAGGGDP